MTIYKKIMLIVAYVSVITLVFWFLAIKQDKTGDIYEKAESISYDTEEEISDNEVIENPPITREAETAPVTKTVGINKQEVYDFMESEFFRITNYGDTYIPEVHDPLIAELAATKFGITADEANAIYTEIAMNMY
ncbi:hypothetical protein ACIQZG_08295 [Lysinibacillus sp. NPDC096418]|uniref:hypothetical protein n=1 Tax=Lysinibacillus sp. NPDC096418 TaxID=3364138 RepID=UPI00380E05E4